jgi:hypothetical protein
MWFVVFRAMRLSTPNAREKGKGRENQVGTTPERGEFLMLLLVESMQKLYCDVRRLLPIVFSLRMWCSCSSN